MISVTRRDATLLSFSALALLPDFAQAATLNPAAVTYELPDQIKWSAPSPAGAQSAVLVGDPAREGLYVQMVKWLAGGHFSHPHFHPHDRFITVLKGTWWVGTGTKFDPDATVPMPAGTFVTHFGRQVHFDGAKDEDAVLLIVGEGPGTATPAEVK
jgi:quercetin dioxygenase-like cupin family protein